MIKKTMDHKSIRTKEVIVSVEIPLDIDRICDVVLSLKCQYRIIGSNGYDRLLGYLKFPNYRYVSSLKKHIPFKVWVVKPTLEEINDVISWIKDHNYVEGENMDTVEIRYNPKLTKKEDKDIRNKISKKVKDEKKLEDIKNCNFIDKRSKIYRDIMSKYLSGEDIIDGNGAKITNEKEIMAYIKKLYCEKLKTE
jgi:hypothetical protein